MTYPSPNPGGEHNWLIRQAVKELIDAQHIPGIDVVHLTLRPLSDLDEAQSNENDCACFIYIDMGQDVEGRAALVGTNNPGGKDITYDVILNVRHRGFDADDWEGSQRDYNRIVDALKDCLRGQGRDLARPDVVVQAADWPTQRNIVHTPSEPISDTDSGVVDRWGQITFVVSQYLPTYVPSAP
jgi:hypothetical protein